MTQEWYYSVESSGDRQGPISAADLKRLADAGTLKPVDLVWKEGMTDWAPAKSIKGLFTNGSNMAAPAPAPAPAKAEEPARQRPRPEEDEEDDRPSARGRDEEEEDDRPRRRRDADEEDDDDRSSGRVRRRDDDDEDDEERPARRRPDGDEDRPRKRKRSRVPEDTANKKLVAGLLGILIGWTGAHRFYLGDTTGGIIRLLVLNLVCAGGIVGLIEGIIYLTKSDEDFHRDYVINQKQWF